MPDKYTAKPMVDDTPAAFTTILASETVSSAFDVGATTCLGLYLPDNFTPCNISFEVARTPISSAFFYAVTNEGVPYSIAGDASNFIALPPFLLAACRQVKVVCDVPQTYEVNIELALAPLYSN